MTQIAKCICAYASVHMRGGKAPRHKNELEKLKLAAAYKPLWTIVCTNVLLRAGEMARASLDTSAAANALLFRGVSWDGDNELLRHRRIRRPAQSWPSQYECGIVKLLGTALRDRAQCPKAFAREIQNLLS